ncbi:hypothetical protein [Paenibacillus allorhizoplanae]|uniref:hypothetical protein n=1 Tax=Paenibacillus allorhizoplanae TaxID=2905648 RepID=UPI001F32DBD2|nr:hypothetical protein [Paenibacillus allorhizoplanae]
MATVMFEYWQGLLDGIDRFAGGAGAMRCTPQELDVKHTAISEENLRFFYLDVFYVVNSPSIAQIDENR